MKLYPYIETIQKNQPKTVSGFIQDYFLWADKKQVNKPYFYGKWSLKWALHIILPTLSAPEQRNLMHHLLTELYVTDQPQQIVQFGAIKLLALRPWKKLLNAQKNEVNIKDLPFVLAPQNYKITLNNTPDNLNSLIFRRTNTDAVVSLNPETNAAAISFRINSRLNQNQTLKKYLLQQLNNSEAGWQALGQPPNVIINHGIQTHTPTMFTIKSLTTLIINYLSTEKNG